MTYQVILFRKAEKTLDRLDKTIKERVRDRLTKLSQNPYDPRISKTIIMGEGERSSRIGNWRIIYEVDETAGIIYVAAVKHRREAYNDIST